MAKDAKGHGSATRNARAGAAKAEQVANMKAAKGKGDALGAYNAGSITESVRLHAKHGAIKTVGRKSSSRAAVRAAYMGGKK